MQDQKKFILRLFYLLIALTLVLAVVIAVMIRRSLKERNAGRELTPSSQYSLKVGPEKVLG